MDSDYGPGDAPGDVSAAADAAASAAADAPSFDVAGLAGLSDTPGQSIEGALGQMLFDLALQQDTTSAAGMKDARSTLDSLANLGFGRVEGLNPNNPAQSVEEMLAAQNVATAMGYIAPAIANLAPGFGTLSTIGRVGAGLMSGTMTPGQAFSTGLAGLIGAKTGIPSGLLEGVFAGDLGKAAGSGAQAGLGALASNFGPFGSLAYGLSGLGSAVNRGVSEAVSGATGGARSGGLGSFLGSGAGAAPSTSTASTGSAYGDAGITQEISPTRAAIEQAVRETSTPAWDRQVVAGRYGPTMQYEYGA